ncbi:hypothetical protein [Gimesia aquarii]|uniref:Uncharacterized protein n=1 Tax=Gimesia aquarii TaxID=2527964 RepID=A0A517W4M8_9PLAN|nr:hypothetical protein [Gimesia aquarii]QDU00213.1 hypothetical protein V144x_57260 [Gimesia aquarii]
MLDQKTLAKRNCVSEAIVQGATSISNDEWLKRANEIMELLKQLSPRSRFNRV